MSSLSKEISDLSPEKRELLKLLLQEEGVKVEDTLILPQERIWDEEIQGFKMPLSFAQKRLWFLDQFSPNSSQYNLPTAFHIQGNLDIPLFEGSIQQIIHRHESLRTNFVEIDGEPFQIIRSKIDFNLGVVDLRALSREARESEVNRRIREEAMTPFKLTSDTLFRIYLLQLDQNEHIILATMHHIISDGWSMGVLVREIVQEYVAHQQKQSSPLNELVIQYSDFAIWQQNWLKGSVLEEQLGYWKQELGGSNPILGLPTDFKRPPVRTGSGASYFFELPGDLSTGMRNLSKITGNTLFVTLLTSFVVLLYRYTQQDEIRIGTPIAGRNRRELEGLIGFFVNTLVMNARFDDDPSFRELLAHVQKSALGAYSHQDLPFEMLVDALQPERDMSIPPLFQVMFSLQNAPTEVWELPGIKMKTLPVHTGTAKFDLSLILYEKTTGNQDYVIGGILEYDSDLFLEKTIQRMIDHYLVLLGGIESDPDKPVSELDILTNEEYQLLVQDWSVNPDHITSRDATRALTIHEIFEIQAGKEPEARAVVYENNILTYDQLNRKSNQLAHYLRNSGVGPDMIVGVCVERSVDLVVAIFGVLKSGAAYLPLDPAYPPERISYMLKDSKAGMLISQEHVFKDIEISAGSQDHLYDPGANMLLIDTQWRDCCENLSDENPVNTTNPGNLAYVIYTSGSTGLPKGVMIEHRSAVNLLIGLEKNIYHNPFRALEPRNNRENLNLTLNAPLSFDASVQQWILLLRGHTLFIVPQDIRLDGEAFLKFIRQNEIDVLDCVPSQLKILMEVGLFDPQHWLPLAILPGGEAIDTETWEELANFTEIEFFNMYGPTECAVDSTICHVRQHPAHPSIGRPNVNVRHYVLDKKYYPVPIGVPGELFIGGEGTGRGYLYRPELTAERFIPNPLSDALQENMDINIAYPPDDRIYKTGDLVRYLPNGYIEYLGRTDYQVKIRGFRIELGEIENVLVEHSEIKHATTLAFEDRPGFHKLVAYVVPEQLIIDNDGDVSILDPDHYSDLLRDIPLYLKSRLPDYMVPGLIILLNRMPLTPNAKVDRKALPEPDSAASQIESVYLAPRNQTEETLASIWSEILNLPQISVIDNFFELGGHSLMATQVLSRARKAFNLDIPLRYLFDAPTIAGFGLLIDELLRDARVMNLPPIEKISRDGDLPLSFGQMRLWFLDQLEPDSPVYNIPDAIHVKGYLDLESLERSLNVVVSRHEILRSYYPTVEGKAALRIKPQLAIRIPLLDISSLNPAQKDFEVKKLVFEESGKPFDLSTYPLFRVKVVKLLDDEFVILFTLHHIISDGWSSGILINEIARLYPVMKDGAVEEVEFLLPELDIQYVDYAGWQRTRLSGEILEAQLNYWKDQLKDLPPVLELPTDRPRPAVQSSKGDQVYFEIPLILGRKLRSLSQEQGTTLFILMLAIFQVLLYRYTGQSDISVGTPIANRNRPEIEKLIGFFVNTLVLRGKISEKQTFQEFLSQVKETALEAYSHQEVPFEMLVDALQPDRNLSHTPLFQVMFMLQNSAQTRIDLPDLKMKRLEVNFGLSMFDLTMVITEAGDELFGGIEFNSDLFDKTTVHQFADHYLSLIESIVHDTSQSVTTIPYLSKPEEKLILHTWNETNVNYQDKVCIPEMIEERVKECPDHLAIIHGDIALSYAELNARANQLARYLRKRGVGQSSIVGISIARSVEMIIGLLAILKSGAAYLPLDPDYPADRLDYLIRDSKVRTILSNREFSQKYIPFEVELIEIETEWEYISKESSGNLPRKNVNDKALAYIIYTSGSTGLPKGVMIEHRSMKNFVQYCIDAYDIKPEDRMLQFATINFDTAVEEIYPTLSAGATLVLRENNILLSSEELHTLISTKGLTILDLPTAYWHEWVHELLLTRKKVPSEIRMVIIGGEKCIKERYENWLEVVGSRVKLVNTYGPTEATVVSSHYWPHEQSVQELKEIPIGKPISNVQLYILDRQWNPVPIGVHGELSIGGAGIARGYLDDPRKTASTFIPDAFGNKPGGRLYRTGDSVRFLRNGNIEYIGRVDHQVKIRGFRVELGEIDNRLIEYPDVREAVTVAAPGPHDHLRLVGYIVPAFRDEGFNEDVYISDLRTFLGQYLPDYMIPSQFVILGEIPITPTGKLDRKALPEPGYLESEVISLDYIAPRNDKEETLARVWSEVLGIKNIGINDNFFELGGDSILSIQVVARSGIAGLRFTPQNLFENPTIAGLAGVANEGIAIVADQGIVSGDVILTPVQKWFFEQEFPHRYHFNQALLFEVKQPIDYSHLEKVVEKLLTHHDALRLRFSQHEGEWVQFLSPIEDRKIFEESVSRVDLTDISDDELGQSIRRQATEYQASLDIENGPIFRAVYFDAGLDRNPRLLVIIHHLAIDGVSWRIILEDLQSGYYFVQNGDEIQLPPKTTSFKKWSEALHQYAQSDQLLTDLNYWEQITNISISGIPTDYENGENTEGSQRSLSVSINEEETESLLKIAPSAYKTEITDLLLTALVLTMKEWTRQNHLLLEMEGHGREDLFENLDISRTVGWFTSIYPLMLRNPETNLMSETIKSVKEQLRQLPNHGISYGMLRYLVDSPEINRSMASLPDPKVSFNYLGQFDQLVTPEGIFRLAKESRGSDRDQYGRRSTLLDINGAIIGGKLAFEWSYSVNFHTEQTITWIAGEFINKLRMVIEHCLDPGAEGYTPSDFPLADLDQRELDKLLGKLKRG